MNERENDTANTRRRSPGRAAERKMYRLWKSLAQSERRALRRLVAGGSWHGMAAGDLRPLRGCGLVTVDNEPTDAGRALVDWAVARAQRRRAEPQDND